MKSLAKLNYQKALGNYYHKTKGYIDSNIAHKIEADIEIIDHMRSEMLV